MRLLPSLGATLALLLPITAVAQQDRPGVDVSFHGTILLNGFSTSGRTNNTDLPQFAVPETAADSFPTSGVGGTLRQTRVSVRAFLPELGGAEWRAELDADFFGGQQPSNGGRTFPLLRIRRAWLEGSWNRFAVLIGQEAPPIVELNPVTLSSIGLSALSSSGNLWLWIPQLRLTGDLAQGKQVRLSLEGAVLAPTGYTPQPPFTTDFDLSSLDTATANLAGGLAVSAWWILGAAICFLLGFRRQIKPLRLAGFFVAGLALLKVVFVDLSELDALYRVGSACILGVASLGVAYAYHRGAERR